MKSLKGSLNIIDPSQVTIDMINPSETPSLVGFWKGNDVVGSTVPDSSGNGYDLTITHNNPGVYDAEFETVAEMAAYRSGYLTLAPFTTATIEVSGTDLDTQGNSIIWTAELIAEGTLNDADMGTAWDFGASGTYEGFMLGGQANSWYARVKSLTPSATTTTSGTSVSAGTSIYIAAGFVPSDRLVSCVNGGTLQNQSTTVASLVAQDGRFGFGVSASQERISVRNYQLWSFSAEPANLNNTVEWMSHNPGKIPAWWVGR
jgi:hypothetical protein